MIDRNTVLKSFADDEDIFRSVAQEFVAQLPSLIEQNNTDDMNALMINAHTLKGLAATFCHEPAKKIAGKIEELARDNKPEEIQRNIEKFKSELENLQREVIQMLEELNES